MKLPPKTHLSTASNCLSTCVVAWVALTLGGCSFEGERYMSGADESFDTEGAEEAPAEGLANVSEATGAAEGTVPVTEVGSTETELVNGTLPPSSESPSETPSLDVPAEADGAETTGASSAGGAGEPGDTLEAAAPPVRRATLVTSGRQLLDTCGQPFVVRGVEQIFAEQLPQGNDWVALIEQIAETGVNAVRVLANTDTLSLGDVDALLSVVGERGMVAYVTPYGNEATGWLEHAEVRAMLAEHERFIIIDAFGEPTFDDRARFVRDSTETLRRVREWGYRVPLTVTANQFGRDLPSLLELGAEITAADPLGNTILGWQAYWGSGGYYMERYGMSLIEAVQAVASAPFPIQLGLDRVTDFPSSETADFSTLLSETQANGIGWLWWDWYNPYGNENNLTEDGSAGRLTPTGETVVRTHPASVANTSRLPCSDIPAL